MATDHYAKMARLCGQRSGGTNPSPHGGSGRGGGCCPTVGRQSNGDSSNGRNASNSRRRIAAQRRSSCRRHLLEGGSTWLLLLAVGNVRRQCCIPAPFYLACSVRSSGSEYALGGLGSP